MKKNIGFTLIELLVVIVIIGILASLSVPLFQLNKEKAKGAMYIAKKNQAAKEQYEACMRIHGQNCGPEFVVHADGTNVYKKDLISGDTSNGTLILQNNYIADPHITSDGKYLVYKNSTDRERVYMKDLNSTNTNNRGTEILGQFRAWGFTVSPDNNYIIYRNRFDGLYKLYKKKIGTPVNDLGVILVNNRVSTDMVFSLDGNYVFYTNNDLGKTYKKNINSTNSNDPGILVSEHNWWRNTNLTPDGKNLIYCINSNCYFKAIDSPASDMGTLFLTGIWAHKMRISPDGNFVVFGNQNNSGKKYKKYLNADNINDPGELLIDSGSGNLAIVVFP